MKKFLKTVFAVIVGILIVNFITFFIVMGAIGSADSKPMLPHKGVLSIDMSKIALQEQVAEDDFMSSLSKLQSGLDVNALALRDVVTAIQNAATDPAVQYIFLKTDGATGGMAQLGEFRRALKNFHNSCSKPIIAYSENPSTGSYYIASVADKVYTSAHEGANFMLTGIGTQLIFVKDLLDRLGVNVQLIRHGKYKAAGEMFTKSAPSPENLEQNRHMINSIWSAYSGEIAESRNISVKDLNSYFDELKIVDGNDMVLAGLADGCLTKEELRGELAKLALAESYRKVQFIDFASYVEARKEIKFTKNRLAIIYADGEIVDGENFENISGDRFARIIAQVREDSTIKAVVLRVNSPGGSVLASEKIKSELDLMKGVKPIIASYGDYAASGGYWISANSDKIFASPTTLTGSIGVFSLIPDLSDVARKLAHVNIVSVKSNKHADMYSMTRALDSEERSYMQKSVESVYSKFVNIVSEGRELEPAYVDGIAQGRVWAGADALKIGLVDEMGTLEDALAYAALCAGDAEVNNWQVVSYPKPLTFAEAVTATLNKIPNNDVVFAGTPLENAERAMLHWKKNLSKKNFMFARMPYLTSFEK